VDIELRKRLAEAIFAEPGHSKAIESLKISKNGTGSITYRSDSVWIAPEAPAFSVGRTEITDEEMVRAFLLVRLITKHGYPATPATIEIERSYKPVGRPIGKGGRVDILVRRPQKKNVKGNAFLFVECKAPSKYDEDMRYIDGQLFRLSLQEQPRPKYLLYYTVDFPTPGHPRERAILVDTETFTSYDEWDRAGQPITDVIPVRYGKPKKRRFANVVGETNVYHPLDRAPTQEIFSRLRTEIHDVIWGGGGTNNNEVFVCIVKLILCKIFDEKETLPGKQYEFQRLGDEVEPETPEALAVRLNALYAKGERAYLALPRESEGPAFDISRLSAEKLAYVLGRLEGLSVTENVHHGDLLGEFFEQIVSQDFTQTKGQFFTPIQVVRFMLHLARVPSAARDTMTNERDRLGRPRLPYIIDPSCGSGSFLIEYMRLVTRTLADQTVMSTLPNRVREAHRGWFVDEAQNSWAREFIFGIENNHDLGLAAKVNMVLHGDGSMNTWINSGLLPFKEYWVDGRTNILGTEKDAEQSIYQAPVNEQYDFVFSNPPFSLKLSPDEEKKVQSAFCEMNASLSEKVFIERWFQLLKPGGLFCCVLPETILDTGNNATTRLFLLRFFRIEAVVSLPYDAFRPFTSTKTCIVLARRRPNSETKLCDELWKKHAHSKGKADQISVLKDLLSDLGWIDEQIFMAEPKFVGYKRRKNLPDLPMPNQLYASDQGAQIVYDSPDMANTVLGRWTSGPGVSLSPTLGFWTTLRNVISRDGFRLDPKYRWLWDFQNGVAHGDPAKARELSLFLEVVQLQKVAKGELGEERMLIDLEHVESRQALISEDAPLVDVVGSEKVRFDGCDLAISKLEPYLGKIMIDPPADAIGSPEWIGLRLTTAIPKNLAAYMLMLPDLCEAYRRLQSGKRHARFDPAEFLQLKVELPLESSFMELDAEVTDRRTQMMKLRQQIREARKQVDELFGSLGTRRFDE
jgi:type I restriction enzyme M protein